MIVFSTHEFLILEKENVLFISTLVLSSLTGRHTDKEERSDYYNMNTESATSKNITTAETGSSVIKLYLQ